MSWPSVLLIHGTRQLCRWWQGMQHLQMYVKGNLTPGIIDSPLAIWRPWMHCMTHQLTEFAYRLINYFVYFHVLFFVSGYYLTLTCLLILSVYINLDFYRYMCLVFIISYGVMPCWVSTNRIQLWWKTLFDHTKPRSENAKSVKYAKLGINLILHTFT